MSQKKNRPSDGRQRVKETTSGRSRQISKSSDQRGISERIHRTGLAIRLLLRKFAVLAWIIAAGATVHAADDESAGILILGGTRGLGLETVKRLDSPNQRVTVMTRPTSDLTELNKTRARQVTGDALNRPDIDAALASGRYHTVIASLPGTGADGWELDVNAIDSAAAAGISRYILISSIGVGDSADALPWIARMMLRKPLANKEIAERHLIESGMAYTIIRPGNLSNKKPNGKGILTEDRSAGGSISRAETARLIAETLESSATLDKTYAAIEKK